MNNLYQIESALAWLVAIVLTFQLAGCNNERRDQGICRAKAALAIAEAEQSASTNQATITNQTTAAREEPTERQHRILYFGARSCPACRVAEESLERLAEAGWRVGPEPDNHIQTFMIDASKHEQSVAQDFNIESVPTWIRWENGRELVRRIGPLDPFEIGRLFE